jgi:plastocyanin/mono/diheme cytochrome c family protein
MILYLADEPNRLKTSAEEQQHDAVERAVDTYLTQCLACHGPAGEGYTAPGEGQTGRIGAAIGGDTPATALNQTGIQQTGPNAGKPWSDPNNPQFGSGLEGRANFIRNRIHTGLKAPNGTILMPAFGQEYNGPLNDSQIDELVTMIQHVDWNEVYNKAIQENGGYPTPPPAPTATGAAAQPTQAPAQGGQQTTFEIDMVDIAFQPTELKIPANTDVTITAVNKGNLPHTFTVPGVADTGEVPAGQSVDVKVNLKPGTYDFHCAIPGHEAAGMVGKLIVEEAPAGGAAPAASPTAGGAAAASGQATTIEVDMVDIAFNPAEVRIPANTDVTIHAVNSGALPHTLTIPDVGDTGEVPAGASHDLQVNLPAGEYAFHCAIPGHEAAGMVGKLIVEEGGAPAVSGGAAASPGAEGGQAAAPSGPVEVDMVDLAFNPTELTIPANTDVTIHAVNSGALPHTFTIPDVVDTGELAAGDSKDVTVNLPPGEYDFHCAVPGHEAAGMVGKLIVK